MGFFFLMEEAQLVGSSHNSGFYFSFCFTWISCSVKSWLDCEEMEN